MYIPVCIKAWTTTDTRNSVNKFQMQEMKKKNPDSKGYVYYDFIFMAFWKG